MHSRSATPTAFLACTLDPREYVEWRAEILESAPTPSLRSPLSLISLGGRDGSICASSFWQC